MINITLVVFIAIILVLAALGDSRGLFGFVFGAVSWLVTIVLIITIAPLLEDYLMNSSGFYEKVVVMIGDMVSEKTNQIITPEQAMVSDMIAGLSAKLIHGLARLLSIVFAVVICTGIGIALKILDKIPVIEDAGRILGFVMGLFSGLMICFILLYLTSCFEMTALGTRVLTDIQSNQMLLFFYENNPLKNFF